MTITAFIAVVNGRQRHQLPDSRSNRSSTWARTAVYATGRALVPTIVAQA
ncbi:hypothetical protein [Rhodococcus marinonascens]|nr:hypothetical protein [Rhodococcus marinonascens]